MGIEIIFQKQKNKKLQIPSYPDDFTFIKRHPLDPKFYPTNNIDVFQADIIQASLQVGYGRLDKISDISILSRKEGEEFARYLLKHAEWLSLGLDFKNGSISYKGFKNIIESSDQSTESYYFGMIFGYIAFSNWLPPGVKIKRMLHVSTFSRGSIIKEANKIIFNKIGESAPDLICEDDQGDWHFVEAKGGGKGYRYKSVKKALRQLDGISNIRDFASGNAALKPRSCICSFVQIYDEDKYADQNWKLWVVDPRPEKDSVLMINADIAEFRLILIQERIIEEMQWARNRPFSNRIRFKRSPLKDVLVLPMSDDLASRRHRDTLVSFEELTQLVMYLGDQSMWLTSSSVAHEILSAPLRRALTPEQQKRLLKLLSDDLHYRTESIIVRKMYLVSLLFKVLSLDTMLTKLREQREEFFRSKKAEFARHKLKDSVILRQLTCGSIVVGFERR